MSTTATFTIASDTFGGTAANTHDSAAFCAQRIAGRQASVTATYALCDRGSAALLTVTGLVDQIARLLGAVSNEDEGAPFTLTDVEGVAIVSAIVIALRWAGGDDDA